MIECQIRRQILRIKYTNRRGIILSVRRAMRFRYIHSRSGVSARVTLRIRIHPEQCC